MSRLACLLGFFCLGAGAFFAEAQTSGDAAPKESREGYSKIALNSINSDSPEMRPLISDDGNTLYFCRRFHTDNYKGDKDVQDVWVSYRDTTSDSWSEPIHLGNLLNNKKNNAIASISPDGQEGIFFNTYKKIKKNPLVRSRKSGAEWTKPQALEIQEYVNISDYADFYLDFKQNVLLLAIEGEGSVGDQDLYVSFPDEKGGWKAPLNMGQVLNSTKADFAPFMGADGYSLFFCSYGHGGLGGSDIFMSVRLDDSWERWSEPQNLGPLVNTAHEETYFSITSDFKYLYYYSSYPARAKNRDITRVELPEDFSAINGPVLVQLDSVALSKIRLSGNYEISPSMGDSRGIESLSDGRGLEEKQDMRTGQEQIASEQAEAALEQGKEDAELAILANLERSDSLAQLVAALQLENTPTGYRGEIRNQDPNLSLNEAAAELKTYLENALPGIELELRLENNEVEIKIGHNLMYDFNSLYVTTEYVPYLSQVARIMRERPALKMKLVGYTDNIGSEKVNKRVANARVRNLVYFFKERGVDPERIELKGEGQENPLTTNDTEEGRSQNRRVETFIKYKE